MNNCIVVIYSEGTMQVVHTKTSSTTNSCIKNTATYVEGTLAYEMLKPLVK